MSRTALNQAIYTAQNRKSPSLKRIFHASEDIRFAIQNWSTSDTDPERRKHWQKQFEIMLMGYCVRWGFNNVRKAIRDIHKRHLAGRVENPGKYLRICLEEEPWGGFSDDDN